MSGPRFTKNMSTLRFYKKENVKIYQKISFLFLDTTLLLYFKFKVVGIVFSITLSQYE